MRKISAKRIFPASRILSISLFSLLLYTSCEDKVIAKFEIRNNTPYYIDSLLIEPNVDLTAKYISLDPDKSITYRADMTGTAKTDGSYRLSYKLSDSTFRRNFGYFTNGYPLGTTAKIDIQADSALISYKDH